MKDRWLYRYKWILIAAVITVFYWLLEATIDTYFFFEGGLWVELFYPSVHEIWMRSIITLIILGFGIYVQYSVNKLRESKEELRKSEKKYREWFKSVKSAITIHSPEGGITSANPAAEEVFDLKEKELKERSFDDWKGVLYKENGKEMEIDEFPVSRVYDSKNQVKEHMIGISTEKTGEIKWYINTAVPQFNKKGEIERVISSFKDITKQKKFEDRKDFLNTLLRQDLRSKYQTIQGFLQLIEGGDLSEEHRKYLRNAIGVGREANEILDLAKKLEEIEESEWTGEKDIVKVLRHVTDDISSLVERKGVQIEKNYPEKIPKVKGDYSLKTLFSQILLTRIQRSNCDSIRIDVEEREEDILLRIEDDGKPLPAEIKKMFSGEVYTGETTGAGGVRYYMLREIAEHNNCRTEVQDSDMGGARFDVLLQKV